MAYGIYLMHGGDPSAFDRLSEEDLDIMLNTYMGLIEMQSMSIAAEVATTIFGKK